MGMRTRRRRGSLPPPAPGTVLTRVVPGPSGRPCGDAVVAGPTWLAVADGVGSRRPHELASHTATAAVATALAVPSAPDERVLEAVIHEAWAAVVDVTGHSTTGPIATTLTVAWAGPADDEGVRAVLLGWVGDSPAGWWDGDGTIHQVTEPHRPATASSHRVDRVLCADRRPAPELRWFDLPAGGWLWAGSDGIAVAGRRPRARCDLASWTDGAADDAAVVVVVP
jgi:hypothetical protein